MAESEGVIAQPGEPATTAPVATESQEAPRVEPEETESDPKAFNKAALLKDLHDTRQKSQALKAQVEALTAQAKKAEESVALAEAVQRKYDRLEGFLTKVGGPFAQALDSKSFTQALFETDTPVEELATQWAKDHPTLTTQALGAGTGPVAPQQPTISELLHAAIQKAR